MRVGLSSNYSAHKGLAADAAVLTRLIEAEGHEVLPWQFDNNTAGERVDLLIFLEVINPCFLKWASRSWLCPNPEWFRAQLQYLMPRVELVLCKTHDAERLFRPISKQVYYTGFSSEDFYDHAVPRRRAFLHNHGASEWKNTIPIIRAWEHFNLSYPLTLIGEHYKPSHPSIRTLKGIPKDELVRLKNEHLFHLMPSSYEGFGISLSESLSCGAVVVGGAYPPLDEFAGIAVDLRIPPDRQTPAGIATKTSIHPAEVMKAVDRCWRLTDADCYRIGSAARQSFLDGRARFESRFRGLIRHVAGLAYKEPLDVKNLVDNAA